MKITENTLLFGKYQITGELGSGRSGSVLLGRHVGLNQYRAIKRVAKADAPPGRFLREALMLKSLRHPGIPLICDLEEDRSFYYIIEEYLEGESLLALVKRQGSLSRAEIISYGSDLCRIMDYLHSLRPNPILYLDLQPKNLLICGGALKLIDFDQAVFLSLAGMRRKSFATPGFAAPELYTDVIPDQRADLYAIGALLYFMGTGKSPKPGAEPSPSRFGEGLSAVIRQCLSPSREQRFSQASEMLDALLSLRTGVFSKMERPLLTIAVAGAGPGAGVTHTALALSAFLTAHASPCLYEEKNLSGAAKTLGLRAGTIPDRRGIFFAHGQAVKPHLGAAARPDGHGYQITVLDFGTGFEEESFKDADLSLLLLGAGEWKSEENRRALCGLKGTDPGLTLRLLVRLPVKKGFSLPEEAKGLECFSLPWIPDPFLGEEESFYPILAGTKAEPLLLKKEGRRREWPGFLQKLGEKLHIPPRP